MSVIKINLGCGSHIIEKKGWVNIDNFYLPENKYFKQGDALALPIESNSVDYIVCDQMLEHLKMSDVPVALYEIKRILKKGGTCNIMVPDFEDAVKQWLSIDHNGSFEPMKYHYYSEVIYGNQNHEGEYHKTPMCAGYLHFLLNMVGLPKHEIIFCPAFGEIPNVEGARPYKPEARLRNAQLLCKITK